jgi:hypothetical protein
VSVVADLSGAALRVLEGGVRFLKVSHRELIEVGYGADNAPEPLAAGARRLQEGSGALNVTVSQAARWRGSRIVWWRWRARVFRRGTIAGRAIR